ncbi:MAG: PIN domain-containing protein [Anaerolineales bacterium]|nr:PIN domain-containing protein [Anaerolineales bacterium]
MIVVDTNIIGYLYLSGERSAQAESAYLKDPNWAAPLLWRNEFRNVLALYLRRDIFSLTDAMAMMNAASNLMTGREYQVPSFPVLELASKSTCSAYDCEFVALAKELKVPLITVDHQILFEFPSIAVYLDDFIIPE